LDLAKQAVVEGLDDFKGADLVGLRIFTTDDDGVPVVTDLSPVAPIAANREALVNQVQGLIPRRGTPLYQVTSESFTEMLEGYDPSLINAVIVLTDGQNDDDNPRDDREQFETLLAEVRRNSEGENSKPIRIFTV